MTMVIVVVVVMVAGDTFVACDFLHFAASREQAPLSEQIWRSAFRFSVGGTLRCSESNIVSKPRLAC